MNVIKALLIAGTVGFGGWILLKKVRGAGLTVEKGWASIMPYFNSAFYMDNGVATAVAKTDYLVEGRTYGIMVSTDCKLEYPGYGWSMLVAVYINTVVWDTNNPRA